MNVINNIIISLANVPLTLESGLKWDYNLTSFLMKNSPFFIRLYNNDSIELVNKDGEWLLRTSFITESKMYPNGYVYFITASNHKYGFVPYCDCKEESTKKHDFPLVKPEYQAPKLYESFAMISYKEKNYYYDIEDYLVQQQSLKDGKYFGKLSAKKSDYGFVDNMFVHISDAKDSISDLEMYNGYCLIGTVADGKKGKKIVDYTFDYSAINFYREKAMEAFISEINERIELEAQNKYKEKVSFYNSQSDIWRTFGFCAINEKTEVDSGAYKDYKRQTTYTFSRNISDEEFISFLKEMKQEIKNQSAWWEDYSTIKGSGNTWTYTWVRPSTH